jgi:hypothetical protein
MTYHRLGSRFDSKRKFAFKGSLMTNPRGA